MAAGFEYFTSADAGAPVLNRVAGSFVNVLDWVLQSKGGWDIAFTGTNLRAYRSQTGNRFFLRVDDTQARYARTRAYRNMTAISTGTNQFPTNAQATNINTWGITKSYYMLADTYANRYWGIRTNRYVIIVIEFGGYANPNVQVNYRTMFAFGDVPSLCEADSHSTILLAYPGADTAYPQLFQYIWPPLQYPQALGNNCYGAISGTPNGGVLSPGFGHTLPFPYSMAAAQEVGVAQSGRLHIGDIIGFANDTQVSSNTMYPRTRIPNLHQVYGPVRSVNNGLIPTIDLEEFTVAGKTYKTFAQQSSDAPVDSYSTDALLLQISDTDGAL